MRRTKTGGAYDWDLDYHSPSMLRVYVFLVDWRVAVAVTTRFVWVFKVGTRSRLRLQLRLLRCLPKRLTAVTHRRAEFLRPSPSVHIRGLMCLGVGRSRGERVGRGEREGWVAGVVPATSHCELGPCLVGAGCGGGLRVAVALASLFAVIV